MKATSVPYAKEAYEIITHAATVIGSRLPGSAGEKKFAAFMGEKLRAIGVEPKSEEFSVAPRSAIGGIPYAGWSGLIISVAAYVALYVHGVWFAMAALGLLTTFWLIFCCFLYKKWFDRFFPQKLSQNVYGEITPPDGHYDYTVMLSAHLDTSWCWLHSADTYKNRANPLPGMIGIYIRVGFGAACFFIMTFISLFMAVVYASQIAQANWAWELLNGEFFRWFVFALHFVPAITAVGCCFVIQWNDPREEMGSRGAMDNASGIALSYEVMKYFKEHPEQMPKNCRLVDMNIGSEEAGLRGSMAFVAEHKNDGQLKNVWNINIDSIADEAHFNVIVKDDWQGCRFDGDLERMFIETFRELGMKSKEGGSMHNPVGGCDSTPLTRAGIKSVTFAAQEPALTYYYHTWHDMPDRFTMETVGDGFDVVLGVIDKIAAFQEQNGFPGVKKSKDLKL